MYFSLQNFIGQTKDIQNQALVDNINSKYYYYTRTKGLFRVCYPKERPPTGKVKICSLFLYYNFVVALVCYRVTKEKVLP